MLLEGLQLPLTTPFYPDGRLNLRKLEQNAAAYSKTPAAGLAVLSGNGEPEMLSDEETLEVLRAAIAAAAVEKVMLAGAFRESVKGTLAITDAAAVLGYDAALVRKPRGLGAGDARRVKETLLYFQAVADRSAIPLVLCDEANGEGLAVEMIAELAGHPRIAGMVLCDAAPDRVAELCGATAAAKREVTVTAVFAAVTGRMLSRQRPPAGTMLAAEKLSGGGTAVAAPVASSASSLKTRTKTVGFQILAGSTARMLDALLAGAVGAMPPFAACAPQACYEVMAAWKDKDRGLAEEKQERLRTVARRVEEELGIAAVKFGCDLNGYCGGQPRLPRLPLTGAEREEVEALMQGLRS
jgi:dihydrodipicolinate synthase/N-acetylneuraminate lyase